MLLAYLLEHCCPEVEDLMVTLQECMDLTGLEAEEIDAIAEHERVPQIVAAEMGYFLLATADGRLRIRSMIADDMERALRLGNRHHAAELGRVLSKYVRMHPD
jgi:hypothetical protein